MKLLMKMNLRVFERQSSLELQDLHSYYVFLLVHRPQANITYYIIHFLTKSLGKYTYRELIPVLQCVHKYLGHKSPTWGIAYYWLHPTGNCFFY